MKKIGYILIIVILCSACNQEDVDWEHFTLHVLNDKRIENMDHLMIQEDGNTLYITPIWKDKRKRIEYKVSFVSEDELRSAMAYISSKRVSRSFTSKQGSFILVLGTISTLLAPLAIILTLIALVSILKNSFKEPFDKIIWLWAVIFIPIVGAVLYLVMYKQRTLKIKY